jgi:phosphoribosyl 1,2-cyclic phosphodiesterase
MDMGINVYASAGTIEASGLQKNHNMRVFAPGQSFTLGEWKIMPFDTQHDCKEPVGFLIYHPEIGKVLFATDTYYLKYKFSGLHHVLIECNYSEEILKKNEQYLPKSVADRIRTSHFELQGVIEMLKANDLQNVQNIVLLHLSDGNSNAEQFKEEIQKASRIKNVFIADPGLEIELRRDPF